MYLLLLIFHGVICVGLIAVILLQAGRGGGLTEAFGGGSAESLLGTKAPDALKKATAVAATLFLINSLVLAMITARRERPLIREEMPFFPGAAEERVPLRTEDMPPVEREHFLPPRDVPAPAEDSLLPDEAVDPIE